MKKDARYFTTGEFAKICKISKQTLQFYDKKGIFSPIFVDDNGYRYYSLIQYDTIYTIKVLKEINVPLEDIKKYLESRTPKLSLHFLEDIKTDIENNIIQLNKHLRTIDKNINYTKDGLNISACDYIKVQIEGSEHIIIHKAKHDDYMVDIIDFTNKVDEAGLDIGLIGAIISSTSLGERDFENVDSFFMAIDNPIEGFSTIKPKGLYASIMHFGSYSETHISYNKLLEYLKDNLYEVIGPSYEKTYFDHFNTKNEDEYLMKLSVLVNTTCK